MSFGSLVRLGWYFFARLVSRAFRREPGLALFKASFEPEGLTPVSLDEREALRGASRCIACGRCDTAFDAWPHVERSVFRGPSELPRAISTGLVDAPRARRWLTQLERGDLEALERVCPTGVPFVALAAHVRARAGEDPPPPPHKPKNRVQHDPG